MAVAATGAALAPWARLLHVLPWGADATKWTGRAAQADAWHWIFLRKHFVGYRPVTALSFAVNQALTGFEAWGYRATDFGLWAACLGLLLAVYRRWFGGAAGLAAVAAVALCHPVLEEVVPFPSRRSYLLAAAFGLAGLLLHDRALASGGRSRAAWSLATGAAMLLAVGSNEVAYVFLPLVALRAALERPAGAAWTTLPTAAALAAGVASRWWVLGSVSGGYQKRYFAVVRNHVAMWMELQEWEPVRIALAQARYLFVPNGPGAEGPLAPQGWPQDLLAAALAAWVVAAAVAAPAADRSLRRRWLLAAWLAGSAAIVVLSQTWFWRQAWSLLLPLALLAGDVVASAVSDRRWWARLLAVGPLALLVTSAPYGALLGAHLGPHAGAVRGTALVEAVEGAGVPPTPARVFLGVAEPRHTAQIARLWLDRRAGHQGRHAVLTTLNARGVPTRARHTLTRDGKARWLALTPGLSWATEDWVRPLLEDRRLRVDGLWRRPGRAGVMRTWLVLVDRDGVRVEELFEPASGKILPERRRPASEDEVDDELPDGVTPPGP